MGIELVLYEIWYGTYVQCVQWNLSIKDTLNKGHLSNEDTVCSNKYRFKLGRI